jgi:hypothetical protein
MHLPGGLEADQKYCDRTLGRRSAPSRRILGNTRSIAASIRYVDESGLTANGAGKRYVPRVRFSDNFEGFKKNLDGISRETLKTERAFSAATRHSQRKSLI